MNWMNENIWTPFFKKDNLWRFGTLTDLFKTFCGKLELAKVRNVHPEVTFFCGHFYLEVQIISKKAEFPEKQKTKKWRSLFFFGELSYLNHASHLTVPYIKTVVYHGCESIAYLRPKIWNVLPASRKKLISSIVLQS